ncbi:hypothetical protein SAMN04487825_1087 [Prevotella sp. kh1p2]|nr:hypothetical protein SAMN04487825_1087 [Prevotella sp. kh1p2]SNU11146.1 hypothetical protein SAMN06298210_1087 [Prevotellaceae bacterium KH2P17]
MLINKDIAQGSRPVGRYLLQRYNKEMKAETETQKIFSHPRGSPCWQGAVQDMPFKELEG